MSERFPILPLGVYESPLTDSLRHRLERTLLDPSIGANVQAYSDETQDPRFSTAISHFISEKLASKLSSMKKTEDRVQLINDVLELLGVDGEGHDSLSTESLLHSVYSPVGSAPPPIPGFPLTEANLLTNADSTASMHSELQREIKSADSVDLICAFVKQAGLRTLDREFKLLASRGVPFRVIASVYTGATEAAAVHKLASEYGAEVKINYNIERTRLHAKAWLFKRNSGFSTAFIGSSNLSRTAMLDGLEWNVRTTQAATPIVVEKFIQTFDTYWADPEYLLYDRQNPEDLERLTKALRNASFGGDRSHPSIIISGIDVEPRPHQRKALEALDAARTEHDQHRNLVIAATGTGKTITAALDYRSLAEKLGRRPRLLFIAHTREILEQSRAAYAQVLKDGDFGELLVGGQAPVAADHVFASIQSLNSTRIRQFTNDHFDVVVVDEFHHAAAPTYRRVLDYFHPKEFLGLTATPERSDGIQVQSLYQLHVADELRLWDALKQDLLAPMHYYGINDGTSLVSIRWSATSKDYDTKELTAFYESSEERNHIIFRELEDKVGDLNSLKALGFCVSVEHAYYMAQVFNKHGIPAASIDGTTDTLERQKAFEMLRKGAIKVLFGVNVFNEGLDIRSISTVLLLRPTQSPVLFLQQIGRGLRHHEGKSACVILDFIGLHREEYDVSNRYAALVGATGKRLQEIVANGFTEAPPGTHIQLDRITTKQVLDRIKRFTKRRKAYIVNQLLEHRSDKLVPFLDATGLELEKVYFGAKESFTDFRKQAGLIRGYEISSTEEMLLTRIATLLHVDDPARVAAYISLIKEDGPLEVDMDSQTLTFARMLIASLWTGKSKEVPATVDKALTEVRNSKLFVDEFTQVLRMNAQLSSHIHKPLRSGHGVLFSHARYSAIELKAAISDNNLSGLVSVPQSGVLGASDDSATILFINLIKDKKSFSAQTRYADFPLNAELFQWESPHTTRQEHKLARSLINHEELGRDVILAMRISKDNSIGRAQAYTLLGTAAIESYWNEKPITFRWKLDEPMPGELLQQSKQAV